MTAAHRVAQELRELQAVVHGSELTEATLDGLADELVALRQGVSAEPAARRRTGYSLFHGPANPLALPMEIVVVDRGSDRQLVGRVLVTSPYEGPPGHVHGGYLAGLFDDLLGGVQRLADGPVALTGKLTVRYRRPTPLHTPLTLTAWVHQDRGRRLVVRGECHVDDALTAQAEGLFVRVGTGKLGGGDRER